MNPVAFSYHKAESLSDAVARIVDNPEAKILAGGHSLIPAMKLRLAAPGELVDITGLDELKNVTIGDHIEIGALATYNDLLHNEQLMSRLPIFVDAISQLGDRQVRARGTFGGSIAHADPAADLTAVLLALGGHVNAVGPNGQRSIPVDEYFVDLWTTALEPDEVLTSVVIPMPSTDARMVYVKHRHPASGYAVVGIAVVVNGNSPRATITGATSKPERLPGVESAIASGINDASIEQAVARATEGIDVNGDLYADAQYRSHLIGQLVKKALRQVAS